MFICAPNQLTPNGPSIDWNSQSHQRGTSGVNRVPFVIHITPDSDWSLIVFLFTPSVSVAYAPKFLSFVSNQPLLCSLLHLKSFTHCAYSSLQSLSLSPSASPSLRHLSLIEMDERGYQGVWVESSADQGRSFTHHKPIHPRTDTYPPLTPTHPCPETHSSHKHAAPK